LVQKTATAKGEMALPSPSAKEELRRLKDSKCVKSGYAIRQTIKRKITCVKLWVGKKRGVRGGFGAKKVVISRTRRKDRTQSKAAHPHLYIQINSAFSLPAKQ
jgi:hypothetical protein